MQYCGFSKGHVIFVCLFTAHRMVEQVQCINIIAFYMLNSFKRDGTYILLVVSSCALSTQYQTFHAKLMLVRAGKKLYRNFRHYNSQSPS